MPNQRKEGKKMLGAWIPDELAAVLKRVAKADGVSLSTLVEKIITQHAVKNGYKPKN
jgi:predicted HicB family RNase H-like nuclease